MTFLTNKMREEIRASSNAEKSAVEDVSDSNSSTCLSAGSKRKRRSSTCTSKYKGVVSQQNGHWGCQIYANQRRIWLGTFKSEEEAAKAYESAALKIRGGETQRNFHLTAGTNEEQDFQSRHSVDAVLNMIKDGSYQSKFADYLKTHSPSMETELSLRPKDAQSDKGLTSKQLFQKELTPSDVGKLNRLVIPKKYATKFFPHAPLDIVENVAAKNAEDVQLSFYDRSMKLWKFRYCYWSSSQSYVFTRGWNRFVKEKQLKANDTVVFLLFVSEGDGKANQFFYVIDVNYSENNSIGSSGVTNIESNAERGELQLRLGEKSDKEREFIMGSEQTSNAAERRAFKLFGVQIN